MAEVTIDADPGPLNFKIKRGDKIGPVDVIWPAGNDLSDRDWAAQVRGDLDEGDLVATFVVDVSSAATGTLTISLPHSESKLLATPHAAPGQRSSPGKGTYFWDLQGTSKTAPDDDVHTWVAGTIKVTGDSTVVDI